MTAFPPNLDPHLRELAARGVVRSYRKRAILITEGDPGDTIYIVLSGRLRAYSSSESGREITFGVYGAGEYLGEMSLDGGPRSASVATLEASVCAVVTRETIRRYLTEQPDFGFELLAKVIRRARAATLSTRSLALNDAYGRLKEFLERESIPGDEPSTRTMIRPKHADVAAHVGCSREMVSRLLKDLERGGHLRFDGRGPMTIRTPLPARW